MFIGQYSYRIDEKGRLPLPPPFRLRLKDGVVLFPGAEKCINVYPWAEWKKLADSLTSSAMTRSKMRRLNRAIFAGAFSEAMDGQGRIALPAPLRTYAGIGDDVVVAGVNSYLELWNKADWDAEQATDLSQAWQIIESLEPPGE